MEIAVPNHTFLVKGHKGDPILDLLFSLPMDSVRSRSSWFLTLSDEMLEKDDLHHLGREKLPGDIERRKQASPLASYQIQFGRLNYTL